MPATADKKFHTSIRLNQSDIDVIEKHAHALNVPGSRIVRFAIQAIRDLDHEKMTRQQLRTLSHS